MSRDDRAQTDDSYTESQVIMSTVKIVTPFVLTYGLFITFHGADTPGGGFQGGAVIGEIDVDGSELEAFDGTDARFLEEVAALVAPLRPQA